jgi:multicomponent Na+:H+ antiporter subunit C
MYVMFAVLVWGLYAAGFYMMMRRSIMKLAIGLVLIGHAGSLLIFASGRLTRGAPPIIDEGAAAAVEPFADPLPQALILTAIVIGFGVLAFALVLAKRTYEAVRTDDLDEMKTTDV